MLKSGVIVINKPEGFTSHDVIAKLRGILKERKLGHSGTLDPMATGVLPVLVRNATKACEFAAAHKKTYIAGLKFGVETDTQDITGRVVGTGPCEFAYGDVKKIVESFKGEIEQNPPMYSAIQIDGQRLYNLARQGITKNVPKRGITIFRIELREFNDKTLEYIILVECSKGTYVRTICHDIGKALGSCAVMTSLKRISSGDFNIGSSYTIDQIEQYAKRRAVDDIIIDIDKLFSEYPSLHIDKYGAARASNGAFVPLGCVKGDLDEGNSIYRVYFRDKFIMLGMIKPLDKGGNGLFCYKNFGTASIKEELNGE